MHNKPFRGAVLNRNHPLVRGLRGCWILNEHAGNLLINSANNPPLRSVGGNCLWSGGSLLFPDNATYTSQLGTWPGYSQFATFEFCYKLNALDTTGDMIFESSINFNIYNGAVAIFCNYGAAGRFYFAVRDTGYREEYITISDYLWHHFVAVLDNSTTQGDWKIFVDGVERQTTISVSSKAGTLILMSNQPLYLGSRAGSSLPANGELRFFRIWDRMLSDAEVSQLHTNPYAMFEQPSRAKYFFFPSLALTQSAFRFFNDDGDEDESTPRAGENTDITFPKEQNIRIRLQIDATGNPDPAQYQLEVRRKPSGGSWGDWYKVPVA